MLRVPCLSALAAAALLSACAYQGYEPPPQPAAAPPAAQYNNNPPPQYAAPQYVPQTPPSTARRFIYGASERQLGPNRFEITYAGPIRSMPADYNQRQPYLDQAKHQAEDFALLRAAQIAQANGRPFFIVLARRANIELGALGTGDATPNVSRQLASAEPGISDTGAPERQEAYYRRGPRVGICVGCGAYPFYRPWYPYSYYPRYWRPSLYAYWYPYPYWNPYWDTYPRVDVWQPYPEPYASYAPNRTARAIAVMTVTLLNAPIQNAFNAAQTEAQIKQQYGLQ